ncbi:MAG: zf-TFIIB domain-containing protein [Gemmatimonadales bacterium]|nr:zf-TFIIB domain-containing protein [Gemmatimonadales bacterium]
MTEKPSQNEDEYFARQNAELLETQRIAQQKAADLAERKTHYMRCPKDGGHLEHHSIGGVEIDRCPDCNGIWLDDGELDTLAKQDDPGYFGRFFGGLFANRKKA